MDFCTPQAQSADSLSISMHVRIPRRMATGCKFPSKSRGKGSLCILHPEHVSCVMSGLGQVFLRQSHCEGTARHNLPLVPAKKARCQAKLGAQAPRSQPPVPPAQRNNKTMRALKHGSLNPFSRRHRRIPPKPNDAPGP